MLHIFFNSVIECVISLTIICLGSSNRARDLNRVNNLIKKGSSVLGMTVEPLEMMMQRILWKNLKKIWTSMRLSFNNKVFFFSLSLLQFLPCNKPYFFSNNLKCFKVLLSHYIYIIFNVLHFHFMQCLCCLFTSALQFN